VRHWMSPGESGVRRAKSIVSPKMSQTRAAGARDAFVEQEATAMIARVAGSDEQLKKRPNSDNEVRYGDRET